MDKITSGKTIDKLETLFSQFGIPEMIVSDNGPQFISHEFSDFCKFKGILHLKSPPYYPPNVMVKQNVLWTPSKGLLTNYKEMEKQQKKI